MTLPKSIDPAVLAEALRESPAHRTMALTLTAQGFATMAEERAQFIRSAWNLKRISWGYRRNAIEDEAAGNLESYRRNADEARRLWRTAKAYLGYAEDRSF